MLHFMDIKIIKLRNPREFGFKNNTDKEKLWSDQLTVEENCRRNVDSKFMCLW